MQHQSAFGFLLRRLRAAANLTQEELAERSGLSVEAVGALERGDRRSPRPSTVEFLAAALGLDTRQRATFIAEARGLPKAAEPPGPDMSPAGDAPIQLAEAHALLASMPTDALPDRGPLPAGSRMQLAPNPLFVGRSDELLQIAKALRGGETTVALGHLVASTGLGGLGKTQLAVELVHRYGRFFVGGVFWLSFARPDEIPLQVAACAGPSAMDLAPGIDTLPLEERVQRAQRAWRSAVPRLLVFDNCEEETLLETWRPPSGGCRVLVTSRRSHWSPTLDVTALPLDLMPRPDSMELLRRYRPDLAPDDPSLEAIAEELGDLPLALHVVGSYLRAYGSEVSLDGYLAELRRSDIVQHASLLGAGLDDSPSPTHHVQSVAQTFALCLGSLDREREVDRVAIAILARMAYMAPGEPVPRSLLAKTMEDIGPLLQADGLRRLGAVGLVDEGEGSLRLHRLLVHFVRQDEPDRTAPPAVVGAVIGCGDDAWNDDLTGSALGAVIPHVVEVATEAVGCMNDCRVAAELCTAAGRALARAGDLRAARPWCERALTIWEKALGPVHPDTARGLTNLAMILYSQGELAAARLLSERALAIRERVLGSDHPDTAESLTHLGCVLWAQGELAARPAFERALAIRERALGPDHPLITQSLNNVGVVLWTQGEPTAAKPVLERALAMSERVLGADHPSTARGLDSLARLLQDQGDLDAARDLFERALAIRERALGAEHPETASSLNGLARLLHAMGELDAAGAFFERALEMRKRVLGPDHPHTTMSLNDLAMLLRDRGRPGGQRPRRARLAMREPVLGPNHPHTATTIGHRLDPESQLVRARNAEAES